ncbi:DNA polymerase III subunit delta [Wukongibacter baidiensis]|uniref:DNA polymerase III subunit delta n=1 Tax=Wukongibacter baidiensis TaxID=1723361 RepID=UPI003D7F9EF8
MSYKSLLKDIKENNVSSVYLFFGKEKYLINKGMDLVKDRYFSSANDESFNYNFYDGIKDDIDVVLNSCETLPFMGEKRIVIVKSKEAFSGNKSVMSKDDEEKLIKYISNIPETTCLIFIAGDKIDKRKKLVKEIKSNGKILEFDKLDRTSFVKWIQKILKSNHKGVSNTALEGLIDSLRYLERDSSSTLYDVENEIKKLCNYIADKEMIELSDIEKIMTKPLENNIFLLVDSVANKNSNLALKMFNQMLIGGEPEGRILHMIVRQFKILNKVKIMIDRGYTASAIAPKISLPQYIAKKYVKQSNGFSAKDILNILNLAAESERKIKTGKMPAKLAIEMLITGLCR